jgi:hypothetical protein
MKRMRVWDFRQLDEERGGVLGSVISMTTRTMRRSELVFQSVSLMTGGRVLQVQSVDVEE